jgi:aryl-alcohol dehydrogenase-like predicted oxidoreductase
MKYRKLGRTDIDVSVMALGCWPFAGGGYWGEQDDRDSIATVHAALDAGINFFDTAEGYGRGHSERVLGEGLRGRRHEAVIATKVSASHLAAEDVVRACEGSLANLQTDYIDLYQIHRPQPSVPIDETLRALDDLIRAGKVRYIGTSTFAAWQFVESLWASKELGLNRFVCEQPPYNLLDRRIERGLIPMAQTYGVGIIPWSPLAGGLLTGKYRRGEASPSDARYADVADRPWMQRRMTEGVFDVVELIKPFADEKACKLSQFALAWVLCKPGVTSPIIGPRTMEQLEDNLGALQVEVTSEDHSRIDELVPPGSMHSPFYEADFGPHEHRW